VIVSVGGRRNDLRKDPTPAEGCRQRTELGTGEPARYGAALVAHGAPVPAAQGLGFDRVQPIEFGFRSHGVGIGIPGSALEVPWPFKRLRWLMDHYADAVRAEPGQCWRMVVQNHDARPDIPAHCPAPALWIGSAVVGKVRMRLWSCQGHIEGLEDLRPV
jgi:hypothetical protein